MYKKFMTIKEFSEYSGLAVFYVRQKCKDGTIPCIKRGRKNIVNVDMAMENLDKLTGCDST